MLNIIIIIIIMKTSLCHCLTFLVGWIFSLIKPLSSLQRKTLEYCFRIIQTKEKIEYKPHFIRFYTR